MERRTFLKTLLATPFTVWAAYQASATRSYAVLSTVQYGDPLTAQQWNDLITTVNGLQRKVN